MNINYIHKCIGELEKKFSECEYDNLREILTKNKRDESSKYMVYWDYYDSNYRTTGITKLRLFIDNFGLPNPKDKYLLLDLFCKKMIYTKYRHRLTIKGPNSHYYQQLKKYNIL